MGKKKRKSNHRKSGKCPEPFNTLIDFGAGLAMSALASHKEEKHGYSKKGQINPYAASAIGFGMGKINSTEDVIRLGGTLGAMGAFDHIMGSSDDDVVELPNKITTQPDDKVDQNLGKTTTTTDEEIDETIEDTSIKPDDGIFESVDGAFQASDAGKDTFPTSDGEILQLFDEDMPTRAEEKSPISFNASDVVNTENVTIRPIPRNTWRKYCSDGSEYGLDPNDFDTADEYEDALRIAKYGMDIIESETDLQETALENTDDCCDRVESRGREERDKQPERCRKYSADIDSMVKSKDMGRTKGNESKYCWRKYCENGSEYGIFPENYETADDYAEALEAAKNGK